MGSLMVDSNLCRDYDTLVAKVQEVIKTVTEDWNDFSDGDIATILVNLFISITDMQFYQFDKGLLEQFVDTVKERPNLISILKNVGYYPKSFTPMIVSGSVENSGSSDFELKKHFVFIPESDDLEMYKFLYLGEDVTVEAGSSATVKLYQCVRQAWPELDNLTTFTNLLPSTVNPSNMSNIRIPISGVNDKVVIDKISSIEIRVGNDWEESGYREVTNFVDELEINNEELNKDKMFRLFVDRDNITYLEIYNAQSLVGKIVRLNYYTTDGASVPNGLNASIFDSETVGTIKFTVGANPSDIQSGSDPETIDEARDSASKYVRSLNKAVTSADYKALLYEFVHSTDGIYRNYERIAINPIDYYVNYELTGDNHCIQNLEARAMYVYLPILGSTASRDTSVGIQIVDLLDSQIPTINEYLEDIKMIGVVDNIIETHEATVLNSEPSQPYEQLGKVWYNNSKYWYRNDYDNNPYEMKTDLSQVGIGDYYLDTSNNVGYYMNADSQLMEMFSCRAFYKYGTQGSTVINTKLPVCITRFTVNLTIDYPGYTADAKADRRRKITQRLAEYYGLSDEAYGRSLNIGELFSVIMGVDLNAVINIATGLKYNISYDINGDNTSLVTRYQNYNGNYDCWINEVLLFGGITFN